MAESAPLLDDRTKALIREGMFKPFDAFALFAVFCGVATLAAWIVFGTPTAVGILAGIAALNLLVMLWLAFLVLRCIRFVIDTRAEINMMPEHAARLALQFGRSAK